MILVTFSLPIMKCSLRTTILDGSLTVCVKESLPYPTAPPPAANVLIRYVTNFELQLRKCVKQNTRRLKVIQYTSCAK